jgi:translation initiation factor IF-2
VLRDGVVIHQTKIGSMKHVKEVVNKATTGTEFGITLENFNDLKVNDIIQSYKLVEVKREFK